MRLKYYFFDFHITKTTQEKAHRILISGNNYYRNLSGSKRKEFVLRCLYFMRHTVFRDEKKERPDYRIVLLISSAFVQITFGLKTDRLKYFKVISIAPEAYSYQPGGVKFKGDVSPERKSIRLARPYVEEGFYNPYDALNVAIHEFGHALIVENSKRRRINPVFRQDTWSQFKKHSKEEISKIRSGASGLFRSYAGSDFMEFFAVALEVFFEQPEAFKKQSQKLYFYLSKTLNQDPVFREDPVISKLII